MKKKAFTTIAFWLLPLLAAGLALMVGRMNISPQQLLNSLFQSTPPSQISQVLWNMRLPRILLAALVGAGLSVAGCAFQSLFANPLATPDTLGVASGSCFGAALALLLGFPLLGVQASALLFGILAVLLTWLAGSGVGRGIHTIVLSGIMIGSLFNALVALVKYVADTESQLPAITYWLMGSLNNAAFSSLLFGAPLIIGGICILFLLRWRLNILPLPDDEARSTGTNIRALRITTILCATAITAACVSMCGQVGWVGLLIPHMCRMKFGSNHRILIPAAISMGALFMIVVDTLARTMMASEIPISILTAIIGAPFFILLMRRSGGWEI